MRAHLMLLLAGLLVAAPLAAVEITLTDDEKKTCADGGGCVVVTRQLLRAVLDAGMAAGKAECKGTT